MAALMGIQPRSDKMEQHIQHIGRHNKQSRPEGHTHVDDELLRQLGIEKADMEVGADTRNALEELIGNKVWPRRSHNDGKEPVLAAKGCHRTHGHRRQCLEQTAAQLVEMSPEIHFNLRIEN